MPRTVISLPKEEKEWLDRQAKAERVPMTEIVRRAIRRYRQETRRKPGKDLHRLLQQTHGLWRGDDALTYQMRLRAEWEDRA